LRGLPQKGVCQRLRRGPGGRPSPTE
jgi:hypothetical protein